MRNRFPITIAERLLERERLKEFVALLRLGAIVDEPLCRKLSEARQQLAAVERAIDRELARDGKLLTWQMEVKARVLFAAFEDLNLETLKGGDWLRKQARWLFEKERANRAKTN